MVLFVLPPSRRLRRQERMHKTPCHWDLYPLAGGQIFLMVAWSVGVTLVNDFKKTPPHPDPTEMLVLQEVLRQD